MDNEKMLKAMMQAVTNAVVDVNADEVLDQLYPKIEEKIHQTYGFLPKFMKFALPKVFIRLSALRMRSSMK